MQIVRLNCAFSRNLGRGDDVDGLGAIMRGIPNYITELFTMQDILSENRHSASELSYYFQMKGRKQMAQVNLEIV